ncbi:MAG: VOC family protein [Gammaproteobacteria bacterium]|jgi:PhnB protein|nr:VOC family protein [Gammaproteobacteria bacterium]
MKIEPYLFFDGNAEEAMSFYERALDGKIEDKMRYADSPDPVPPEYMPPGGPDKLMHASLLIEGQRLMFSDGVPLEGGGFRGFSLTLQYEREDKARQVFDALADGGRVLMPMGPTFFSPCYGMLVDRFGVQWMVMVPGDVR